MLSDVIKAEHGVVPTLILTTTRSIFVSSLFDASAVWCFAAFQDMLKHFWPDLAKAFEDRMDEDEEEGGDGDEGAEDTDDDELEDEEAEEESGTDGDADEEQFLQEMD